MFTPLEIKMHMYIVLLCEKKNHFKVMLYKEATTLKEIMNHFPSKYKKTWLNYINCRCVYIRESFNIQVIEKITSTLDGQ